MDLQVWVWPKNLGAEVAAVIDNLHAAELSLEPLSTEVAVGKHVLEAQRRCNKPADRDGR